MAPVSGIWKRYSLDDLSSKTTKAASRLVSRSTATYVACAGCTAPEDVNNKAFFALFALLGVGMVMTSIWFFFWAKNGGFVWRRGDWDDYKSTVLRRRGPNGTTLSNATKSTKLGGGSIYHKHDRFEAKSVVGYDEKGRKGIVGKRGFGGSHSVYYSDTASRTDDMSEVMTSVSRNPRAHSKGAKGAKKEGHHANRYRDRDVHDYKHEKPARVGGMNRAADGNQFDYAGSDTMTQISDRSTNPILGKAKDTNKKRDKAERRAHEEAARMERKWRKDAERAAATLAREREESVAAKKQKKSAAPSPVKPPVSAKRETSRSASPKKRDYSFSRGAETLSTADSAAHSGTRVSSYYDAYRPHAAPAREERGANRSRQASSTKKQTRRYVETETDVSAAPPRAGRGGGGRDVMAGYRRGLDSLASSDED